MTSSAFEKAYRALNPRQKEAVDAIEGPVMVVAGPGTGKTQVLTLRIANILRRTDTAPESILALTFTESAVRSMRTRLVELIGTVGYRVQIATFHGFCNDVIRREPDFFPRIVNADSIGEIEQIQLMEDVIRNLRLAKLKPFGDIFYYLRPTLRKISECKRDAIRPVDLTTLDGQKQKEFVKLYRAYEKELEKRKLYDYDDMVLEALRALETHEPLLRTLQEEYHYFLADEHQDANRAQNRLLEFLGSFHPDPNVFLVGDGKQAIFRFQGADCENFDSFTRRHPRAKVIVLEENYRSTQTILDAAHSLLSGKLHARLSSRGPKISFYAFSSPEHEARFLAESARGKTDAAILFRENRDASVIAAELTRAGVPFALEADERILEDRGIRKLVTLLRAVSEYGNDERLASALHLDFLGVEEFDLYDRIRGKTLRGHPRARQIAQWAKLFENRGLLEGLEIVVRESGFLPQADFPKLSAFYECMADFVSKDRTRGLRDFLAYLDLLDHHRLSPKIEALADDAHVRLLTAHASKGREFETVYLAGVSDGHWGNRRNRDVLGFDASASAGGSVDDERRLFYVALTRAKREVILTMSGVLPSQFVEELDPSLIARKDTRALEVSYAAAPGFVRPPAPLVPVDQKKFFRRLFLDQGLSVTALNNYLKCPWAYFYENLLRVPHAPNKHQLYGIAAHAALKEFFDSPRRMNKARLLRLFRSALEDQPFAESDARDALARGEKNLSGWYDASRGSWGRQTLNEYIIRGVQFSPEITLTGKLDKLEMRNGGNDVRVVDYKTAKPKGPKALEKEGYFRQLAFYQLLLDRQGKYRMVSGELDFLSPDEKGRYKKVSREILASDLRDLEETIRRVADEILQLAFWSRRCGEKDCKYCQLREMMHFGKLSGRLE